MALMKPQRVFLFLLLTLGVLATSSLLLSNVKFKIGEKEYAVMPSMGPNASDSVNQPDSQAVLAQQLEEEAHKTLEQRKEEILKKPRRTTADTLVLMQVEAMESPAKFYYAENAQVMDNFFEALEKVKSDNTSFRILHYGDSQIEMDRISSYLREQLQKTYGGSGMGLLPAMEVTPKYTVAVQSTGSWNRRLTFGGGENRAKHNRYGPMAYFCKKESEVASVVITAREGTTYKNRNFKSCKVLVGAIDRPLEISIASAGKVIDSKTLQASSIEQLVDFKLDSSNGSVGLKFSGANADILGISLDGSTGIMLDNIPMRGCSGTIFRRISADQLARTYKMLGVKMVILQFGGNSLPGMTSKASADAYGKKFYEEIKFLKSVDPNLIVFTIGPADMSVRINGVFQTHPQLENVRDALKKATIDAGGVYWDMYEAMGGRGSMVTWVKSKPALGSPDYIHFSQKGAEKIASIFYTSLLKEFEIYKLRKKINN
jgi:lysophospholipase L1-like esterase